jgi:hypothetical protein
MRNARQSNSNGRLSLSFVLFTILIPLAAFVAVKVLINTEVIADLKARVEMLEKHR